MAARCHRRGLIFIAAATDNLIHAIDVETGETMWTDVLPGGGQTTPIVVEEAGRQFVIIAPAGTTSWKTPSAMPSSPTRFRSNETRGGLAAPFQFSVGRRALKSSASHRHRRG